MSDSSLNEQLIVDYLLGDLPEAEADRLNELSVANDEFAEYLEAIENDLVDDYIRDELSEKQRPGLNPTIWLPPNGVRRLLSHGHFSSMRTRQTSHNRNG